jgi:hypothetical protein
MSYSDFTIDSAARILDLKIGDRLFLPEVQPISCDPVLLTYIQRGRAMAIGAGSEKARSEFIVAPLLLELDRILDDQVSIFSGQELTQDRQLGLNGICDFLISRSSIQVKLEAPVVAIVEAKKGVLQDGWGQCIAEMVAAQRFNQQHQSPPWPIYGIVTTGTNWQFLNLEGQQVWIEPQEYSLEPIDRLLGILCWMVRKIDPEN